MIVRFIWRKSDQCAGKDAYWVEATQKEAESLIFPRLDREALQESKSFAESSGPLAGKIMGKPGFTHCFLVSKDLGCIMPFLVHYPVHQMWNGYSPFEEIDEREIGELEELADDFR